MRETKFQLNTFERNGAYSWMNALILSVFSFFLNLIDVGIGGIR